MLSFNLKPRCWHRPMLRTVAQVVELLDARLERYVGTSEPIAATRALQLRNVRAFLLERGFPVSADERCKLSLIPFIYQELIYDSIAWGDQNVDLGPLADYLQIDFLVYSGGYGRDDVSFIEFNRYLIFTSECEQRWRRREFTLDRGDVDPSTD